MLNRIFIAAKEAENIENTSRQLSNQENNDNNNNENNNENNENNNNEDTNKPTTLNKVKNVVGKAASAVGNKMVDLAKKAVTTDKDTITYYNFKAMVSKHKGTNSDIVKTEVDKRNAYRYNYSDYWDINNWVNRAAKRKTMDPMAQILRDNVELMEDGIHNLRKNIEEGKKVGALTDKDVSNLTVRINNMEKKLNSEIKGIKN